MNQKEDLNLFLKELIGSAEDDNLAEDTKENKLKKGNCSVCGGKLQFCGFQMLGKRYKRFYRCTVCGHRIERIHKHKLPRGTI